MGGSPDCSSVAGNRRLVDDSSSCAALVLAGLSHVRSALARDTNHGNVGSGEDSARTRAANNGGSDGIGDGEDAREWNDCTASRDGDRGRTENTAVTGGSPQPVTDDDPAGHGSIVAGTGREDRSVGVARTQRAAADGTAGS